MKKNIIKISKISDDGKNLLTRIPKLIEEEAELKKGDKLAWIIKGKKLEVKKDENK